MRKKLSIYLPKGKEAKNVSYKVIDGKLEVSYDLKEKFKPKDGDFVVDYDGDVFIAKNTDNGGACDCYVGYGKITGFKFSVTSWARPKRYSTSQEKKSFLDRLEKECGKTWNAEKKCLEDIYKPKFGDIVKVTFNDINCFKRNYMICIYPDKPNIPDDDFFDIAFIDMMGNYIDAEKGSNRDAIITRASIEEEKELFDKLVEVGKKWNPDTKQLEDIRWRAKEGEGFYFVNSQLNIMRMLDGRYTADEEQYKKGNYFRTPEAAQKVADQIKEIFKNSKVE